MHIQFDKRKLVKLARFCCWVGVLLFVAFTTKGILFDGVLAGWDTQGHLYLAQETSMQLRNGQLMFFDEKWFAGYPAFPLYGPLFYYVIAVLSIGSFSLLSIPLLFNIVIYSFSFLFIFAFVFAAKQWFGKSIELVALFSSLLFLLISKLQNAYGIGIASYTMAGLIPNFLGIILLTALIGVLKLVIDGKSRIQFLILSALLLALTFYANPSVGVFAAFCFLIIGLFQLKKIKMFLSIGGISLIFLLPYIIGLIRYLPYASSSSIGYSEIATMPLLSVMFFQIDQVFALRPSNISEFGIYAIPILGMITLFAFIIGVYECFRKKIHFFTTIFILSLGIVFFELDLLVLQSFRFITLLYLMEVFLIAFGVYTCFLWLKKKKISPPSLALILIIVSLGAYQLFFHQYDLLRDEGYHKLQQYHFSTENFDQYYALEDVVHYLDKNDTVNRIAIDSTMYMFAELGGVHSGSSYLAQNGYAVIPGLLAESSLSSPFLIASLEGLDLSIPWGKRSLLDSYREAGLDFADHIKRLELFGVNTIIAFNPGAKSKFSNNQDETLFTKEFSTDVFTIYETQNTNPLNGAPEYKPILFVSKDRSVFRAFTEEWFLDTDLLSYPIVLIHPNHFDKVVKNNQEVIGGIILDESINVSERSIMYNRAEKLSDDLALWIKETGIYDKNNESVRIERITYTPNQAKQGGYWVSPSFVLYFNQ